MTRGPYMPDPPTRATNIPDRYTHDPDGRIDELVLAGAYVHLEHMGGGVYMLICENGNGHWHFTVTRKGIIPYEVSIGDGATAGSELWPAGKDWEARS